MNDPGSLQNLNDIVLPGAVPWWPPAPGWYAVLAVLLALLLWVSFRALKAWRKNTYRRQALRELASIEARGCAAAADVPVLLTRAALSAWPRAGVAARTGAGWHAFLDRTAPGAGFSGGPGVLLDRVSYRAGGDRVLSGEEFERLCAAAGHWIRRHAADED